MEEFGEGLGALLLAGHGAEAGDRMRSFMVVVADAGAGRRVRFLEARADAGVLPHGPDPLVLAALLELLAGRGTASRLALRLPELLRALGWRASAESVVAVEGALARYYRTSYCEVRRRESPTAGEALGCVVEQRLIAGYDLEQEVAGRGGREGVFQTVVDFNPQFLSGINRRSLFGINWGLVRSITGPPDSG